MAFIPFSSAGVSAKNTALPGAFATLSLTILGVLFAGLGVVRYAGAAAQVVPVAMLIFGIMGALILRALPGYPFSRFGPANVVTTVRAGMTALVAAMILASGQFLPETSNAVVWITLLITGVALALDGVDGWLARRSGLSSEFGARFDMEIDAAVIMALSVAALMLGKAGPWVLAIGVIRYAFVAAQYFEPRLSTSLPPSLRRKAVCVLQVAGLCVVALPPVPVSISSPLAALTLLSLVWSFAIDIRWCLRAERADG